GNDGPDAADYPGVGIAVDAELADLAIVAPGGWTCDAPAVSEGRTSAACTSGELASGQSAVFSLQATAVPELAGATVTLTAAATSQTEDPDAANDSGSAAVVVEPLADLGVAIDGGTTFVRGERVAHAIIVGNSGPSAAPDATLVVRTGTRSARTLLHAAAGWSCTPAPTPLFTATCVVDDGVLGAGATAGFTLEVETDARAVAPRYVIEASASSAATDPLPADNAASLQVQRIR